MNDADNYAYEHGYEWGGDFEPCPDCGGEVWHKTVDFQDGEVVELAVYCTNCGYQDVRYDG